MVYLGLRNAGNAMVKPHGRLVVRDARGSVVESSPLVLDTFLPHTAIEYPVVVRGRALAPGRYRAAVELGVGGVVLVRAVLPFVVKDASTAKVYRSPRPDFTTPSAAKAPHRTPAPASPLRLPRLSGRVAVGAGAGVVLLLLASGLVLLVRRRRRRRPCADAPAPLVEAVAQRAAELVLAGLSAQETSQAPPFLTVAEAAERLDCSPQRVHRLLSSGRLTRHKDGRRTFVSRAEVEALAAAPPRRNAA